MPKILVSDKLSPAGVEILNKGNLQVDFRPGLSPEDLAKIISDYDGLVIRSETKVTADLLKKASRLKVVGRAGIGVDNVDLKEATHQGVVVMNTPSGNAVTTAEHAIAMMFAVSRKIPQATASMRAGKWEKSKFLGRELCNKTLGIVGVGNIGQIVANRALGLKMKVVAYDPFLSAESAQKLGVTLLTLEQLFESADYITVHTPLNEKTKDLINREAFSRMKKGVFIINCARGGIVNEKDLVSAIKEGIVAGAAFDVFTQEPPPEDHPLLKLDEVVLTPHLGASTGEAQENVSLEIAEQIVDFFKEGTIRNAVNFPSLSGEALRYLQPYISLAEKIGSLEGQLGGEWPQAVSLEYRGEITQRNLSAVTNSFLKGFLACMMSHERVNYVNAPALAKEKGLKIIESKVQEQGSFANLVTVSVTYKDRTRTISGTIFGKNNPRIVQIDNFYLEAVPEGQILVVYNEDKPGVVGNFGTILAKYRINISRMQLGLEGKDAIAFYNIEGAVNPSIIKELEALPNVKSVKEIRL